MPNKKKSPSSSLSTDIYRYSSRFWPPSLTLGVDAKAEVDRVASALREDEEDGHEQRRQDAELDDEQPVVGAARRVSVGAVRVDRPWLAGRPAGNDFRVRRVDRCQTIHTPV